MKIKRKNKDKGLGDFLEASKKIKRYVHAGGYAKILKIWRLLESLKKNTNAMCMPEAIPNFKKLHDFLKASKKIKRYVHAGGYAKIIKICWLLESLKKQFKRYVHAESDTKF